MKPSDHQELRDRAEARGDLFGEGPEAGRLGGHGEMLSVHTLPAAVVAAFQRFQRRELLTTMAPLQGPCRVQTEEGMVQLPAGWRGMLAINANGHPYPIDQFAFEATYKEAPHA